MLHFGNDYVEKPVFVGLRRDVLVVDVIFYAALTGYGRRGGEGCAAPADSYLVFAAHLFGVVEWDVVTRRAGRLALRYLQIKT